MPNTALLLAEEVDGADLDQALEAPSAVTLALNEIGIAAAALAALAGRFGAFGLALELPMTVAEEAYRTEKFTLGAANESEPVETAAEAPETETTVADDVEPITDYLAKVFAESTRGADAPETGTALVTTSRALALPGARAAFPNLKPRGMRISPAHAMRLMQAIDWIVVALAGEFAALWSNGEGLTSLPTGAALIFIAAAGALKVGLWLTDLYRTTPAKLRPEHGAGGLALGVIGGLAIAAFLAPDARSAAALSATLPLAALLLAGAHAAFALWIGALHRKGGFAENIVLVGATDAAERLARRAEARGDARIVAIVDDRLSRAPHSMAGAPVTGSIEELLRWDGLPHVDRIVVTVTQKAEHRVRGMIEKLRVAPNRIDLLLDYETFSVRGQRLDRLTGAAMACVSGRPHNNGRAILKRAQDLILGSLLLVLFAPVMAAIAIAVKADSQGPAVYRQRRHGFNNRVITVLKFRTMRHDPDAPLRQVAKNDPRITRIGQFLRRTSLDELPQLLNVLAGDMSLVGPRPHAVGMRAADRDLTHIVAEYAHRHQVKPGITGWAQVNGSRGPIDTPASVRARVKLDLDYVSRASLWLDLAILLRTAPALLGDSKQVR